jgi:hypothetical protein
VLGKTYFAYRESKQAQKSGEKDAEQNCCRKAHFVLRIGAVCWAHHILRIEKVGRQKNVAKNKPTKTGAVKHTLKVHYLPLTWKSLKTETKTLKYTTFLHFHKNRQKPKPRP